MPTVTVYADHDAEVVQQQPTTNFNAGSQSSPARHHVKVEDVGSKGAPNYQRNGALFHFDLSAIPTDAIVSAGTINLRQQSGYDSNGAPAGDWAVDIHANTGAFTDTTVTWNTAPGYGAVLGSYLSSYAAPNNANAYKSISLPALIQGWVTTPATNYGIRVRIHDDATLRFSDIYALEDPTASSDPYVTVTYNRPPGQPGAFTNPVAGQIVYQGTTLAIDWGNATDPEGDALTYTLEFSTDSGGSWNLMATGLTTSDLNVGVTAANTPGTGYQLRAWAVDSSGAAGPIRTSGVFTIRAPRRPQLILG